MFNITHFIRKMQIKTTMKYHLMLVRMAAIKKSTNMLERVWREGNPLTLLVGMQTSTPTVENNGDSLKKTGNRTAIWPRNPTAGHTHWGNQNWKRHVYPSVHCSSVYNSQDMEATYMSIGRQMDKEVVVHIHNGILLSYKKEHIWVSSNGGRWNEPIIQSEVSQRNSNTVY